MLSTINTALSFAIDLVKVLGGYFLRKGEDSAADARAMRAGMDAERQAPGSIKELKDAMEKGKL